MRKAFLVCYLLFMVNMSVICCLYGTPSLSSDLPIVYDTKKQCSVAEGNAEFVNKDLCLHSDRIYYFAENAKALAQGNVRITNSQFRVKTEEGVFINGTHTLSANAFRMEVKGQGITGENLQGTTEHLTADNIFIDYNASENTIAGVNISARKGELHGHEYFELYDAVFHIGRLPIFYTPYYRHSFEHSTLRLKSELGVLHRDKDLGHYVRNDLLFDFGWRIKPGLMLDYYRKRDFLVGGILEYNEDFGKGFFKAARIHDSDLVKHTANNPFLKNSRYFMEWRHQGHLNEKTDVVAQIEWMGDKDFLKDFRPSENNGTRQHPDNFAEISHRTENSVTSVLARYRFNHFQRIQERLPEIRFDYLPVRLSDTPLYYQYALGVSSLRENPRQGVVGIEGRDFRRMDTSFGIDMPLNLGPACTFTPVLGTRILHYSGLKSTDKRNYTRFLGQVGFDLRFRAYGDYAYENQYWNIHHFRHVLQPIIQYRYIPHGHQGDSFINAIDREALDGRKVSLQSIDLLNRRDVDDFNDVHLIRLGIENFLYTNYDKVNPQQWMHFNVYQDIRLKKSIAKDNLRRTLSDTFFDFEWSPATFFSFNQYFRVDPNQKRLREAETSFTLKESDLWRLTCSHTYLQDQDKVNNQNSLTLSYRVNSKNVVSAAITVNAHKPDLIRQTYTWSTIIAKTWNLDFVFEWKKRQRPLTANTKDSWNFKFILTFIEW